MTLRRPIASTLGAFALSCAWACPALASPEYPGALREATGAPCAPLCTVCHLTMSGGTGTALKPFAEAMIDQGLEGEDEALVKAAVQGLKDSPADSDQDGVDDISEIADGRDPNASGEGDVCGPVYGCGARVAPARAAGSLDAEALALTLAALWVTLRRRRHAR